MKKRAPTKQANKKAIVPQPASLLADVRELILQAREGVARAVDSGLTTLYWHVGRRVRQDILKEKRAEYGAEIVSALGRQLEAEFGRGFGRRNLFRMIRFAEVFPDWEIVSALMTQLGWTHFLHIIPISDQLKRDFYAEMCRIERWSTRTLRAKIDSMLFERTALSRKPAKLMEMELKQLREEDKLTPDMIFRDPYLLDFLGLKDTYAEKDVESAILREMESFILELGVGFAFLERQKRIIVGEEDYYLDLLFYHRHLRRLVAIRVPFRKADDPDVEDAEEDTPDDEEQIARIIREHDRNQLFVAFTATPAPATVTLFGEPFDTYAEAEAIAALKRAVVGNPDFLIPHFHLAIIYSELGREKEARATVPSAALCLRLY
ncbi:MAG TPA: PDDEXK nuclease domain-containing protein [Candidatus Binatia bacterium]|jgi:predicted nuclease of restriction endonuclease-like (RecB) superfamily|nr:PDDEXK nuclease domain-containing protein [Candidatus Binatia bacterium]